MGWILVLLRDQGNRFAVLLVNHLTRPLAGAWWVGPLVVLFAWVLVPFMRRKHNIMERDDFSRAARFWWAPGWPALGLAGLGLGLVEAPLLHPALAARWAPSSWFGASVDLPLPNMGVLVALGLMACLWGLKWFIHAWVQDRQLRYRAWRWRQGSRRV